MLRFDHPQLLYLAALALPLLVIGWRALAGLDRARRVVSLALRTLFILALAFMLDRKSVV